MKSFFKLAINEIIVWAIIQKRYWQETVIRTVFGVILFGGIFYGVNFYADPAQETLDTFIVGLIVFMFSTTCYNCAADDLSTEIGNGTFEQLYITQHELWYVLFVRAVVNIIIGLLSFFPMLFLFMWLTDRWLVIDYFTLLSSVILAAPSLMGIGYIVGGFFLVMKNVDTIKEILYLVLIGLIALNGYPFNEIDFLPFVYGSSIAKLSINYQVTMGFKDAGIIILNSAVYLVVGIFFFKEMEVWSKRKGTLSHS